MPTIETRILDRKKIQQKTRRIAFEIYEQNFGENEIILVGIEPMGSLFAEMLVEELKAISPMAVKFVRMTLDKFAPLQSEVKLDCSVNELEDKNIIIVDDVLNTGRTLAYGLKPFLNIPIKKLQVAVLVDRNHKSFPISADYVGYSLSTTVNQHIEVLLDDTNFGVYLE
jgi:pyrimidine operon attenuation protein/uracil phosphoribosyltransferase